MTKVESPDTAVATTGTILHDVTRLTGVALPCRLWDGSELGDAGTGFRVILRHPWSLRALLLPPGDLAAGEAYVHGDIDVDGDMVAAMDAGRRLAEASPGRLEQLRTLAGLLHLPSPPKREHERRAQLRGQRHSRERDRAAIAFHYDLPDDFYRAFLDRDLVYSCAVFTQADRPPPGHSPGDEALDRAQARKHEMVCRKLRLRPGARLLDIGCGWGSLLIHAARHHGASGLGVTLSSTQAEAAQQRLAAAGVDDRVEVRMCDYRDLDDEPFDAVASIGMVEHVGPERLGEYHAHAWRLCRPGGLVLTHAITTGDAERVRSDRANDFVGAYVFPDGGLAPAWQLAREVQDAGFELIDVEQLRPNYALTLRAWLRRLEAHHDRVLACVSETDYRIWRAYMAGSVVGFESGDLGVVQVLGSKGADLPLGRSWMLPDETGDTALAS